MDDQVVGPGASQRGAEMQHGRPLGLSAASARDTQVTGVPEASQRGAELQPGSPLGLSAAGGRDVQVEVDARAAELNLGSPLGLSAAAAQDDQVTGVPGAPQSREELQPGSPLGLSAAGGSDDQVTGIPEASQSREELQPGSPLGLSAAGGSDDQVEVDAGAAGLNLGSPVGLSAAAAQDDQVTGVPEASQRGAELQPGSPLGLSAAAAQDDQVTGVPEASQRGAELQPGSPLGLSAAGGRDDQVAGGPGSSQRGAVVNLVRHSGLAAAGAMENHVQNDHRAARSELNLGCMARVGADISFPRRDGQGPAGMPPVVGMRGIVPGSSVGGANDRIMEILQHHDTNSSAVSMPGPGKQKRRCECGLHQPSFGLPGSNIKMRCGVQAANQSRQQPSMSKTNDVNVGRVSLDLVYLGRPAKMHGAVLIAQTCHQRPRTSSGQRHVLTIYPCLCHTTVSHD